MQDPHTALEARVAQLERRVAELEARSPLRPTAAPIPSIAARSATPAPTSSRRWRAADWLEEGWFERGEGLLGKAGIGLVVFGLIFLYRYAVVRGWLGPEARVGIGLLSGGGMLAAGLLYFAERRRYRQILMGGGVVILFITALAASVLYNLVPGTIALLCCGAIAITAFTIAARQSDALMASIGATGALIPPAFLLDGTTPTLLLSLYTMLMVAWTGLLAVARPWPLFAVLAAAASVIALMHGLPPTGAVQAAALCALGATWLLHAALPLLRSRLSWAALPADDDATWPVRRLLLPLLVTVALAITADRFIVPTELTFAVVALLAALGFAVVATALAPARDAARSRDAAPIVQPLGGLFSGDDFNATVVLSAAALAIAAVAGLPNHYQFTAVAAIAATLLWLESSLRARPVVPLAHIMFALVALDFFARLDTMARLGPFDRYAIACSITTVLAAVAVTRVRERERLPYAAAIYGAVHALLAIELSAVRGAAWLASAAYAVVGSALVLLGLQRQHTMLQRAGMLSLALLVARLFLFDLAHAGTGVRIVLFLVIGFGFLGLSYLFRGQRAAA